MHSGMCPAATESTLTNASEVGECPGNFTARDINLAGGSVYGLCYKSLGKLATAASCRDECRRENAKADLLTLPFFEVNNFTRE